MKLHPSVLVKISGSSHPYRLFTRRGFNIESLAAGPAVEQAGVSNYDGVPVVMTG